MPHIQVLDSHVADLIAAGEVVERPASVVKELMENAIDAGCTTLTVEIAHGGMSYIRVTDDGCGIPAGELETAFLRHATSKIRSEYDLEAIGTLGFRGEALAAIAAVSRVEVVTRTAACDFGAALTLEGGTVRSREEAGGPVGTTMIVRDLFFNTPARLKYMKKDAAEGAAVFAAVQREALARPEVAVKFIRDGRQELLTPGDGALKSAVYAVLGRDLALGLLPVRGSGEEGVRVEGFVSLHACCRASRNYQFFFVNGRFVKSRTMMAALEQAYANQKMVGKFPGCVLHITTRPNAVDVNVHPAKTEVKFVSDKRVFDGVYHTVLGGLDTSTQRPAAVITAVKTPAVASHDTVTPNQTRLEPVPPARTQELPPAPAPASRAEPRPELPAQPVVRPGSRIPVRTNYLRSALLDRSGSLPLSDFAKPRAAAPAPAPEAKPVPPPPVSAPPAPDPTPAPEAEPWAVRGELFHTYILVEQGERAYFIDKHAAHERMNFDRLKAGGYTPMVQRLLAPVVFTPAPEEGAALLQNRELLGRFGFEAEDFGGGAVIVRQAPDYVDAGDVEATLIELAAGLLKEDRADPEGARDHLMATMACKAAIKGGQKNGPAELQRVAEAVMSGQVKYCPHGRPVAIEWTRGQLEKLFRRA